MSTIPCPPDHLITLPNMPASEPSPALIVAAYIREEYPAALGAFLKESGLEEDALQSTKIPDLRSILVEYHTTLLTHSLSRLATSASLPPTTSQTASAKTLLARPVNEPVPLTAVERKVGNVGTGNLLSVRVEKLGRRWFDTTSASYKSIHAPYILVTSTDQTLKVIPFPKPSLTSPSQSPEPEIEVDQILKPHKAAILSFAIYPSAGGRGEGRWVVTGSMDGSAILTDLITNTQIQTFHHAKFVVRVAFSPNGRWLATASYDRTIALYEVDPAKPRTKDEDDELMETLDPEDDPLLAAEPDLHFTLRHTIRELPGNPEAIVFHPTSSHLLYTTRSSHLLHYLSLDTFSHSSKSFNPHPADDHVSFAVLNMAIHPEGGLIACQTGDHSGHAGERVLLYDVAPPASGVEGEVSGSLGVAGDERLQTIWTGSQGDDYVLPRMTWLPDGTGIVTTTTTGQLTLLDLSGRIRSRLQAHGGSVNGVPASEIVRDVHAIMVPSGAEGGPEELRIVSVGYDGQICISK